MEIYDMDLYEMKVFLKLRDLLTPDIIHYLETEIEMPDRMREETQNSPLKFLYALKNWKQFNPNKLDLALEAIGNQELLDTARELEWLSTPHLKWATVEPRSGKSFVELLTSEVTSREWRVLASRHRGSIVNGDKSRRRMLRRCIEYDIITSNMDNLSHLLELLDRENLADEVSEYEPVFRNMSDETFKAEIYNEIQKIGLPLEILARGNQFALEYKRACNEGSQQIKFFRLMVVGPEGVGKTSLLKALRSQPFEENEVSTDFIEKTDITITNLKKNWNQVVNFKDRLKETRDESVAHLVVQSFKSSSKTAPKKMMINPESDDILINPINSKDETLKMQKAELPNILESDTESIRSKPEEFFGLNSESFPLKYVHEHWKEERTMLPIEFFTVWDLAGQSYLFCMHSLFLTPRAVYLIPVDLSVSLDDDVIPRKREKGRLERREVKASKYLDIILYWIQTIYSVARFNAEEECKSRIMIVFTKSDIVDDAVERANLYFKKIKDSLIQKTNCMSIVDPEFQIVSAKERNVVNLANLKKAIYKNAESVQFDFALPIRWLDFALKILLRDNPVMGEKEVKNIANGTGCIEDYLEVLQLFHSIGVFFFKRNILIKSLHSLLAVMLHIVSPRYCLDWVSKDETMPRDIEKADLSAVLSSELLDQILSHNHLINVKFEVVELLKEFGIILNRNGDSNEYYIPYLFTGDLSTIYVSNPNDLIFYLHFPDDQVPTSFYFAFISLCLRETSSTNSVPKVAFDCLKFQWENGITWINDFTQHQPYIRIILQGINFLHSCPDIIDLIYQIEMWIDDIQQQLILSGKLPKIVLDCPCGSFPQTLSPCVYYETYQKCSANESHFFCKFEHKHYLWTYFKKQINPFGNIIAELGGRFFAKHETDIAVSLESKAFVKDLFKIDLINGDELRKMNRLDKFAKASFFGQIISTKGEGWANNFYSVVKCQKENKMKILLESFILDFQHSEMLMGEELGFTRYPFNHNPCGICLIVNFENFVHSLSSRKGSNLDFTKLVKTFENVNFLIRSHEDLTEKEFLNEINAISCMDHSKYDAFFCIIMSHGGEKDEIFTKDELSIKFEDIEERFTADKCPSLAKKPKVFIIQACRGGLKDEGYKVEDDVSPPKLDRQDSVPQIDQDHETSPSSKEASKKVPIHVDFYIARATVKGHVSYRSINKGSLFIDSLCRVLASARYSHHLVDIMMEVRRRVGEVEVGEHVQCTEATDRLTKQLFLF